MARGDQVRKFRAWDIDHEVMEYINDLYWFEENGVRDWDGNSNFGSYALMQSTGLKDKNGKEIYEGDIVKEDSGYIGKVFWDTYMWNVKDYRASLWDYPTDIFSDGTLEVIGNVYENPEMMVGHS